MREHSTSWTESVGRSFLSLANLKFLLWPKSTARRLKKQSSKYANSETAKKLETEKARIMSDSQHTARLRKERQRSSDKLKKERASQAAVVDHAHQRWIKNLAINLASQQRSNDIKNSKLQKKMDSMDVDISNERKFNGDR